MGEKVKAGGEINSHEFSFFGLNERDSYAGLSKQEQYYCEFKRVYETAYRIDV